MSRKPATGGLGAKLNDAETRAMLYEGCSITQLGILFGIDNRDISRRIHKVQPCGDRQGYPIYKVKDVAPHLIPADQAGIEEAIKRMHPKDLPPSLTKEYWAGQHARLKFEEDRGDLWRTADVVETFSEVFKTLRMSILLMSDQVARQSELSDKQRDIIQALTDGLLNDLADSLQKRYEHERAGHWDDPDSEEIEEIEESL